MISTSLTIFISFSVHKIISLIAFLNTFSFILLAHKFIGINKKKLSTANTFVCHQHTSSISSTFPFQYSCPTYSPCIKAFFPLSPGCLQLKCLLHNTDLLQQQWTRQLLCGSTLFLRPTSLKLTSLLLVSGVSLHLVLGPHPPSSGSANHLCIEFSSWSTLAFHYSSPFNLNISPHAHVMHPYNHVPQSENYTPTCVIMCDIVVTTRKVFQVVYSQAGRVFYARIVS